MIELDDPTRLALLAAEVLREVGASHALYGGLLLAAYGEPRETRDAHLAVVGDVIDLTVHALDRRGPGPRVAFRGVVFGGVVVDRITLLGGPGATGLNTLDLVRPRSARFAERVLTDSPEAPLRGQLVRVVTPEAFVLLKALSTRDRDLDDAASVLRRSGHVMDLGEIAREGALLAQELPDVAVLERLATIGARAREPGGG